MNQFVAILTVVSVIGHAILGCCSHTAHFAACHAMPVISSEQLATHETSHSHDHHSHDTTSPCNHAPDEDHDCRHVKCQWLTSPGHIDLAFTFPFDAVWAVFDEISTQASAAVTRNLTSLAESPPALPVRLHLAFGVLLI